MPSGKSPFKWTTVAWINLSQGCVQYVGLGGIIDQYHHDHPHYIFLDPENWDRARSSWDWTTRWLVLKYVQYSLSIRIPLLPNARSVLIREMFFGEREHYMHSQHLLPKSFVLSRGVSCPESVLYERDHCINIPYWKSPEKVSVAVLDEAQKIVRSLCTSIHAT